MLEIIHKEMIAISFGEGNQWLRNRNRKKPLNSFDPSLLSGSQDMRWGVSWAVVGEEWHLSCKAEDSASPYGNYVELAFNEKERGGYLCRPRGIRGI